MSDAILERQAVALEGILALLKKSPVLGLPTGGAAAGNKPAAAAGNKPAAAPAANKPAAAAAAAANKPAAAAAAAAPAPAAAKAGTKAPGGKHTIEQVRDIIRKVAADVDKQSALDILADDGGAAKVGDVKPENYDKVYEACEVLLRGEGGNSAAAATEDDDFTS